MPEALRLTEEQRRHLPSDADVAFYEEHGYFVTDEIIPPDIIRNAAYGIERYYRGERDFTLPISGGFLDWSEEQGEALRINDYVSLQNDEVRELVRYPLLGAVAARLARTPQVRLFHDQLISKPPIEGDTTAVGWHVDGAYWSTCSNVGGMLTAWIPIAEYGIEMGPLVVIDGSHRWPGNAWMTTFNDRDLDALEARIAAPAVGPRKVPLMLRPGQVSFHHAMTIHGSAPNRGDRPRVALTVHFQDKTNSYRRYTDGRGKLAVHVNDALCRRQPNGMPDYADPDVCPVLWSEDGPESH